VRYFSRRGKKIQSKGKGERLNKKEERRGISAHGDSKNIRDR